MSLLESVAVSLLETVGVFFTLMIIGILEEILYRLKMKRQRGRQNDRNY